VNAVTVLAVFGVIFTAELPDKTMVASLVLGTRFRPLFAWLGVAAAFLVHVIVAIAAGGLLSLAPKWIVHLVAAVLFLGGAIVLWREPNDEVELEAEDEAEIDELAGDELIGDGPTMWSAIATSFVVVFVAEWGDLTQLLTASLAARYKDPLSVAVGAIAALWTVGAIGVLAGRTLLRWIPVTVIRRVSAVILLILAVITLIELL
jgi:putative Ca2+/H+ antiporter (TMEM165/GDT1 family)